MITVEEIATLTMPNGSERTITIRIHDLRQDADDFWSVAVDIKGFQTDNHTRITGCDWLNAIEGATLFIRGLVGGKVQDCGGTIVPHIVPPERETLTKAEHAQAISEGIKCLEILRNLALANSQPPPESMLALNSMRRALQDLREGDIGTRFMPDDALNSDVREVFGWTGEWFTTGQISPTIIPLIEGILGKMRAILNALNSSF